MTWVAFAIATILGMVLIGVGVTGNQGRLWAALSSRAPVPLPVPPSGGGAPAAAGSGTPHVPHVPSPYGAHP